MKLKLNQTGFSAVEAILILVVVAIIGFTGWFVLQSQRSASKTAQETTASNSSAVASAVPTYTAEVGKFTLRYPADWSVRTDETKSRNPYSSQDEVFELEPKNKNALAQQTAGFQYVFVRDKSDTAREIDGTYSCGVQMKCPIYDIHSIETLEAGGSYGKMYIVQVSEGTEGEAQVNNKIYLYKPLDTKSLPEAGQWGGLGKGYDFYTHIKTGTEVDTLNIQFWLPNSTMAESDEVFHSTDATTGMRILRSFRGQ